MNKAVLLFIAIAVSGCGTIKEKSAPCKRPANLTSYASDNDPRHDCGPMAPVNTDQSALDAIFAITEGAS
jgi:uncharacterized protein YceK